MKARTDFVSNSSSSSFIVRERGDEAVAQMFKDESMDWDGYVKRFFGREIKESFSRACDAYFTGNSWMYCQGQGLGSPFGLAGKVTYVPDADFARRWMDGDLPQYPALESDRGTVGELSDLVDEVRAIDAERAPDMLVDGKPDDVARRKWNEEHWRAKQAVEDKVEAILDGMVGRMAELIRPEVADWTFWYAEIDDCGTPNEEDALQEAGKYGWYRTFSNH